MSTVVTKVLAIQQTFFFLQDNNICLYLIFILVQKVILQNFEVLCINSEQKTKSSKEQLLQGFLSSSVQINSMDPERAKRNICSLGVRAVLHNMGAFCGLCLSSVRFFWNSGNGFTVGKNRMRRILDLKALH